MRQTILKPESLKTIILSSIVFLTCMMTWVAFAYATVETITFTYYNTRELKKAVYNGSVATIQYAYDNSGNRLSQAISLTKPTISVTPTALTFSTPVGSISTAQNITVTNTGTEPLDIDRIDITGTNASEFQKQDDTCSGTSLAPSGACTIGVIFYSRVPYGNKTAAISIISNAPNRPNYAITLSGDVICAFAISPTFIAIPDSGGTGGVTVTTDTGCSWTALSNDLWLSITSGSAGSGSGTVGYSVAVNSDNLTRTGTAAIAGSTLTVSQSGVPCTFSIAPATKSFGIEGGTGNITVTTVGTCAWTTINDLTWVSLTTGSGSGSGTAQYTVQSNTDTTSRQGIMTVAGKPFTVKQGGTADVVSIGIFRGSTGTWMLDANANNIWDQSIDSQINFAPVSGGVPVTGGTPVTGDWNGDGRTKLGIYKDGTWYLDYNGNGVWDGPTVDKQYTSFVSYIAGDIPVTGDWNGNGKASIGIFRKNVDTGNGDWYLDWNDNGVWNGPPADKLYSFTTYDPADIPVSGDWNGNNRTKIGLFRSGTWLLDMNGDGVWDGGTVDKQSIFTAYVSGDRPVTGNWNGDGLTKIGILRGNLWYVDYNGSRVWNGITVDRRYNFTTIQAGDVPVTGQW